MGFVNYAVEPLLPLILKKDKNKTRDLTLGMEHNQSATNYIKIIQALIIDQRS